MTSLPALLLPLLVDPLDLSPLVWNEADALLYNPRLRHAYRVDDGIAVLVPGSATPVDEAQHQRLARVTPPPGSAATPRAVSQFEGLGDWYDRVMQDPGDRGALLNAAVHELLALLGSGRGLALDIGCGTGLVAEAVRAQGWQPLGVDLGADPLRHALGRLPVVQGNAAQLPLASASLPLAYSTFTSSAWEHQAASVKEAFRVLEPGGRYVDVGVHPCFNGGYAEPQADGSVLQKTGYLHSGFRDPSHFKGTIRSRVGAWHRPLSAVIQSFINAGFVLQQVVEAGPGGVPSLLGISAVKPAP